GQKGYAPTVTDDGARQARRRRAPPLLTFDGDRAAPCV
ncbi:MAG: hypothetical protein AVDCRST_MAG87-3704, partial [uncultured Thermomicrobiales bacterium]